ncbi:MAG: cell wall hydrolase [Paracoccaceae bacterium]
MAHRSLTCAAVILAALVVSGAARGDVTLSQANNPNPDTISTATTATPAKPARQPFLFGLFARPEPKAVFSYSRAYLDTLPVAQGDAQWTCLTEALYFEARGESVRGQFAVGEVILNRVDSASFPGTPCKVVNQGAARYLRCQFTYACDGRSEKIYEHAAWDQVGKVARVLLDGRVRELTGGATYYHAKSVRPRWSRKFERTADIGRHFFYRTPVRTASNN